MKYLSIYNYFDYRQLLEDYYNVRKEAESKFSYRFFNQRAGINSVGLYKSVVKGEVNISPKSLPKFALGMGLDEKELKYFELLVDYNHSETAKGKQAIFEQMIPFLPLKDQRIAQNQKEYYSKWYVVAIHQALWVINFSDNYKSLADFLNPGIKVPEVKRAIKILRELEMIEQDQNNFWRPKHAQVTGSGKEVGAFAIHEFQNNMMDLAKEAQNRISKEKRNLITNTMSVSNEGRLRIIEKISIFQKELNDIIISDKGENQICQLNLQFFPITNELEKS